MTSKVNPYPSVDAFIRRNRLTLRNSLEWQLIPEPKLGCINGIPTMRGWAIATNFLLVAIEQLDGQITFGHLLFFQPDAGEKLEVANKKLRPSNKKPRLFNPDEYE